MANRRQAAEEEFDTYFDESEEDVRNLTITSYEIPRIFYAAISKRSAVHKAGHLGACMWYADRYPGRKRRTAVDVDVMVAKWKPVIVGLATAHDKDEADRHEAGIDECLTPLLAAPVKQVREFANKLMTALKEDRSVPYLVWRSYEIWVDQFISKAPDGGVRELKTALAREISDMVEEDLKPQLGDALTRALQWRSPEKLEEVKTVLAEEKAAGRKPRLKGRESCLFMELGPNPDNPRVCIQI